MDFYISPVEARVLGCLIEKEATTPDAYPLTLNSLLTACNQKSSRDPVMTLDVDDLTTALDNLIDKTLVSTWNSDRNRMAKYRHKLRNRISDKFDFSLPELAVLGALFLRGPQTIGEIRTHCARIHAFDSLDAVQQVLSDLTSHSDGPYVTMLARQAGRKESRYAHLFCGEPIDDAPDACPAAEAVADSRASRLDALEQDVNTLRSQLHELEQRVAQLLPTRSDHE